MGTTVETRRNFFEPDGNTLSSSGPARFLTVVPPARHAARASHKASCAALLGGPSCGVSSCDALIVAPTPPKIKRKGRDRGVERAGGVAAHGWLTRLSGGWDSLTGPPGAQHGMEATR